MKRQLKLIFAGLVLAALCGSASAHQGVGVTLSFGVPVYAAPPVVYYPPTYYAPTYYYYAPPPGAAFYYGPPGRWIRHKHRDHRRW